MKKIVKFKSSSKKEREKSLTQFIESAHDFIPSNIRFDYESNYWEGVGNFTVFGANSRQRNEDQLLDSDILPFAKAYVVYGGLDESPTTRKFKAIRAINDACLELYGEVDITKLCAATFHKAVTIAQRSGSKGHAYQASIGLVSLHELLTEKKIIKKFIWKNPCRKPSDNSTSEQADQRRQEKMPDERALLALAEIFSKGAQQLSERDICVTSTIALLMSAPGRGSEPFYLTKDCLTKETMRADKAINLGMSQRDVELLIERSESSNKSSHKALLDEQGNLLEGCTQESNRFIGDKKITLIGVRWYSGKGYEHATKWLPAVMYDVVEEAISRLLTVSEDARSFAKLLEQDPHKFPRHLLCPKVSEDQLLTMDEVALALGMDLSVYDNNRQQMRTSRNQLLRKNGIDRKDFTVTLRDLNKIVRSKLPDGFPYIPFKNGKGKVKVKWSEALYVSFSNALHSKKATIYTELSIPTINTLNEDLAPCKKKNKKGVVPDNANSIFQRWGYADLELQTHQVRHMLDTIAAVNGMDEQLRAKWAMRSNPSHNRYYDHTTPEEYGADFIETVEQESANALGFPTQNNKILVQVAKPRTIQELNTKALLTAHTTEFGMCTQSYISEPCTKYRDCINCSELVCIKGDDGKCERIRSRLKSEKKLLAKDERAVAEGTLGAERWYQRRKLTVERCEALLSILENPRIQDGALIRLPAVEGVSLLDRALDKNNKKRLPKIENFKRLNHKKAESQKISSIEGSPAESDDLFEAIQTMDELF